MSPELQQFKSQALEELNRINTITKEIVAKLDATIPLPVAYEIVDNLWLPNQAARIKTELSSEFPANNGDVILNRPLSEEVSLLLAIPKTVEFLDKAFPEIIAQVKAVWTGINVKGLSDETAIELYNNFRKEPARFADYVKDLWYPDGDALENGTVTRWQDVDKEADSVENGDYLLMTDYSENIRKAQESLNTYLINVFLKDGMSLGNIGFRVKQLVGMINLIGLFAEYIDVVEFDATRQ